MKSFRHFLSTGIIIQLCNRNNHSPPSSKTHQSHTLNSDKPLCASTNMQIIFYLCFTKVLPKQHCKCSCQGHTVQKWFMTVIYEKKWFKLSCLKALFKWLKKVEFICRNMCKPFWDVKHIWSFYIRLFWCSFAACIYQFSSCSLTMIWYDSALIIRLPLSVCLKLVKKTFN